MIYLTKSIGKHCDSSFLFFPPFFFLLLHPFSNTHIFFALMIFFKKSLPIIQEDGEYKLLVLEIELRNRGFPFAILES